MDVEESKKVDKIWKENEKTAVNLASCYYNSILNGYKGYIEKNSKEDFGFNAFVDGIRLGLDIVIPIADEKTRNLIKEKINSMIEHRTKVNKTQASKVNCSFCGKEIECPENMLKKSKKHMCFECFQNLRDKPPSEEMSDVHIDIPTDKLLDEIMPETMTDQIVEDVFPKVWKESKEKLKQLSKREIAEAMFGEGAFTSINMLMRMVKESM